MTTLISYVYSVVMLGVAIILQTDYSPRTFFDTPPMLFLFVALGRWLEYIAKQKVSSALGDLVAMQAQNACLCHVETGGQGAGPALGAGAAGEVGRERKEVKEGHGTTTERGPMEQELGYQQAASAAVGEKEKNRLKIVSEEVIDVDLIQRGDILRVLPGTFYVLFLLPNRQSNEIHYQSN